MPKGSELNVSGFPRSCTETLRTLHQVFLVLGEMNSRAQKQFISSLCKQHAYAKGVEIWNAFCRISKNYKRTDNVLAPSTIFAHGLGLVPYLGVKSEGVLFCKNFVIGVKLHVDDRNSFSYRLDYDPNKFLHLNIEVYHDGTIYPLYVQLRSSEGPFGFSASTREKWLVSGRIESLLLELTKVKFWLKMTIGYALVEAQSQTHLASPPSNDTDSVAEQLLEFVTGQNGYNFPTIQTHIAESIVDEDQKTAVLACTDEVSLYLLITGVKDVRQMVRHEVCQTMITRAPKNTLLFSFDRISAPPYDLLYEDSDSDARASSPRIPAISS